jgi:DNA-binding NarL/FixJ family response regulator
VKTIEVHRSRLMHKVGVQSFAELVQIATLCGLNAVDSSLPSASTPAS